MKAHEATGPSLWQSLADPGPARPALRGRESAEIVVVGAGIAGLSLALHLAEAGRRPVVLEAETPGAGALGASAGIIAPQLVRDTPAGVLSKLGPTLGDSWLRLVAESGSYLFDLIAREKIGCDARPQGFIAPSANGEALAELERARDEWAPYRGGIRVLDRDDVASMTGCVGYRAGILDETGGCLDPLQLARGLAERAEAKGARIFDNSRVRSIASAGAGWRLATRQGVIDTPQVVLCANGGNVLHPHLDQTVLPMHIYEMATEPLPEAMQREVLPGGQCMTDMELDIFSIRYAAEGRLVTAYPVSHRQSLAEVETQVNDRLARMLARALPVKIAHLWHGTAWINSSLLPRIVMVEPGMIAVQACNGRGIATNNIIGREISRMLLSGGDYHTELACPAPSKISRFWLAQRLPNMITSAALSMRRLRSTFGRR